MARITFKSVPATGEFEDDDDGGVVMKAWPSPELSVPDIRIRCVKMFRFSVFGSPAAIQSLVLEPGEADKLPPLPIGSKLYEPNTWAHPEHEGCKVLALDWGYYAGEIDRLMTEYHPTADRDRRAYVWNLFRSRTSYTWNEAIKPTFDLANPVDLETRFDMSDDYAHALVIDSRYPWLEGREPGWSITFSNGGTLAEMVRDEWSKHPEVTYYEQFDLAFEASALAAFRKAYGSTLKDETGAEWRPAGRKMKIEVEERVPFPEACKFGGFTASQHRNFLAFEITRDGRYSKPKDREFYYRDAVFVHRSGSHTRFLFWEHREMAVNIGYMLKYIAIIPVTVADNECSRTMPVSPMRGMDAKITQAFYGNDYFASAFNHALNRRKFLHTKFPADARPVFHIPGTGILIRSAPDARLMPARRSKLGRKVARARTFMADVQSAELTATLPRCDILFAETVQPVAPPAQTRRSLVLDM